MKTPNELRYTQNHEWIRQEGDEATIGITDYAQSELGEIVFVDLPSLGDQLDTKAVFGSIEAVKTVSDLFTPAGGEVIAINEALDEHPELVNNDPYGSGWLIKIKLTDTEALTTLMDAESYKQWTGKH